METTSVYLDETLERYTNFRIIATTPEEKEYTMDLTIPRRISETDWLEISRLLKQSIKVLSKLPVDNALPTNV